MSRVAWKPILVSAAFLTVLTSLPQIYLCFERGSRWSGAYAYLDSDEFAYSAYVNALINGRPRRNDPYTGNDSGSYETLYSIQFIPAYSIAIPARLLGVSASTAFIALIPLVTLSSCLVIFLLIFDITRNSMLSAAGAVGVLCFAVLANQTPFGVSVTVIFPFLRRYMPAFPFPFFFAMALFTWRALLRDAVIWSILAGLAFVVLVYSYFFMWTAAAAWLATLMVLWILCRPNDYPVTLRVFGCIGFIGAAALIPYAYLIAHRSPVIDQAALEFTHRPDLLRGPVLYGLATSLVILALARRGLELRDKRIVFVLSFGLAPLLVFNQQVVTGRSLQPFHYEQFIANYWILTALFLTLGVSLKNLPKRIPLYILIGSLGAASILGMVDATDILDAKIEADLGRKVALKFQGHEGVLFISSPLTDSLATTASNPVLWAQYLYTFSDEDQNERKVRFYKYLYYSGTTEEGLKVSLESDSYGARREIFGLQRINPLLVGQFKPITHQEIQTEVANYSSFAAAFNRSDAESPLLSYAIVSPTDNLSNLDRWYVRDKGETLEGFLIYRLSLKAPLDSEESDNSSK